MAQASQAQIRPTNSLGARTGKADQRNIKQERLRFPDSEN
jgi:hypothetical protein